MMTDERDCTFKEGGRQVSTAPTFRKLILKNSKY